MKYLLIIILLIFSHISFGQVYRFKAFQTLAKKEGDKAVSEDDWDETDIVVVVNFDKDKVQTYGKKEVDVDLIKMIDTGKDDRGTSIVYEGVDNDGNRLNIILISYDDKSGKHVGTLILDYKKKGVSIAFRLRKDD